MSAPRFETLDYQVEEGVAVIRMNRPDKLNAMTPQMRNEMRDAFDVTDDDDDVGAVIVTGAGRAFCAGADLSAGAKTFDYDAHGGTDAADRSNEGVRRDGVGLLTLRIFDSLKPVIAAVNGVSAGAGATMQLAMDFRMASTEARYGFVFTRRGIHLEAASSWFLPRLVGLQTALEWCYTGRVFPAQEAFEKGLVRSLHAPDDLMPAAKALAREIIDNAAPVSVALTRQLMWRMAGASHPMEAHRFDSRGIHALGRQGDAKEGAAAFMEKRPPRFPDRVSKDLPQIWDTWEAPYFR